LKSERFRIHKSRYSSIDCYISPESATYNDIEVVKDMNLYQKLIDNGLHSKESNVSIEKHVVL